MSWVNKKLVFNVVAPYLEEVGDNTFEGFSIRYLYAPLLKSV